MTEEGGEGRGKEEPEEGEEGREEEGRSRRM